MDSGTGSGFPEFSNTVKVSKLKERCAALGNLEVLIKAVASETSAFRLGVIIYG